MSYSLKILVSIMNLIFPLYLNCNFYIYTKQFQFHEHIELIVKEITQDFFLLVQFWNNHVSGCHWEKFSTLLRKMTTEIQNCNQKRKHFSWTTFWKQTFEQHSASSSCKASLFSDAFHLTVVDFFWEFYKLTLNACIYKPWVAATMGANIYKGLAGLTL